MNTLVQKFCSESADWLRAEAEKQRGINPHFSTLPFTHHAARTTLPRAQPHTSSAQPSRSGSKSAGFDAHGFLSNEAVVYMCVCTLIFLHIKVACKPLNMLRKY